MQRLNEIGFKRYLGLVAAVLVLRAVTACSLPLTGDEAYYWEYAHHLALGYHDHPPLVAWIVALSCSLFGQSTAAVRLPFVLLGGGVAILVFLLGAATGRSGRAAWWAGGAVLVSPLFTLAGMATFPDAPLLFSSALFLVLSWRAVEEGGWTAWLAAGAAAGLAALSKLTGLYLLPCLFGFLVVCRERRGWLARPHPYGAVLAALVVMSPFIAWNATHGWDSFAYQYGSRLGSSSGLSFKHLPVYLGFSAAALSPVLAILLAWATLAVAWRGWKDQEAAALFLACMALPVHVFFLLCSLLVKIGVHWSAPATLAACAAFGVWMDRPSHLRAKRGLAMVGFFLALAIAGILYLAALSPSTLLAGLAGGIHVVGINKGEALSSKEIAEILGYEEGARHVAAIAREMRSRGADPFLFTTNYALSSALSFYSGETVHVVMGTRIGAEFDRWDDFPSMLGRDGLYIDVSPIDEREDVWRNLHEAFGEISLDAPFPTNARGVGSRSFYLARCRRFTRDVFTPLKATHRP